MSQPASQQPASSQQRASPQASLASQATSQPASQQAGSSSFFAFLLISFLFPSRLGLLGVLAKTLFFENALPVPMLRQVFFLASSAPSEQGANSSESAVQLKYRTKTTDFLDRRFLVGILQFSWLGRILARVPCVLTFRFLGCLLGALMVSILSVLL